MRVVTFPIICDKILDRLLLKIIFGIGSDEDEPPSKEDVNVDVCSDTDTSPLPTVPNPATKFFIESGTKNGVDDIYNNN